MGSTNGVLLPYPELTDTADGPDAYNKLANAVEDFFYDRILPAGVTRWLGYYWGVGTNFPTVAQGLKTTDSYFHSGLGCLMGYDGTNWRQREKTEVPTATARNTINANYGALLYPGFQVYQSDIKRTYEWTGADWMVVMGQPGLRLTKAGTQAIAATTWTLLTWDNPGTLAPHSTGMWASATPSRLIVPERGRYHVNGGSIGGTNFQIRYNSGGIQTGGSVQASLTGLTVSSYGNLNADEVICNAGDYFEMFVYNSAAGSAGSNSGYNAFFSATYIGPILT